MCSLVDVCMFYKYGKVPFSFSQLSAYFIVGYLSCVSTYRLLLRLCHHLIMAT